MKVLTNKMLVCGTLALIPYIVQVIYLCSYIFFTTVPGSLTVCQNVNITYIFVFVLTCLMTLTFHPG